MAILAAGQVILVTERHLLAAVPRQAYRAAQLRGDGPAVAALAQEGVNGLQDVPAWGRGDREWDAGRQREMGRDNEIDQNIEIEWEREKERELEKES